MKRRVEDLERRVTALEIAQGSSAASQMGKLSRKHPTEAQRAASVANAAKAREARSKKANPNREMKSIIDQIWKDDDGWWAILKPGWTVDGATGVREDTKKLLMQRIKDAKKGAVQ